MSARLAVVGLSRMAYGEALELQRALAAARINKAIDDDLLLLVEHPPVVTLGRGARVDHLRQPPSRLRSAGIEIHEVERGGDVTYHGPGQLVGYPIFDLSEHKPDLHWFLRRLEQAVIVTLDHFGIRGARRENLTGVWVDERKIASIGIHVRKWVTWHGLALNVTTDLSQFGVIVPCGIPNVVMTSMQRELGDHVPRDLWGRTLDGLVLGFAEAFHQTPQAMTVEDVVALANGTTGRR